MVERDETEVVAERCITSLARKFVARLPGNTKYEYEDLTQEGWIVYWRIMTTKRLRWRYGSKEFAALLRECLRRRYLNILRQEQEACRASVTYDSEVVEETTEEVTSPERAAQYIELISALRKVNVELAYYLIFGFNDVEFGEIRYLQRQRKHGRWTMNGMRYRWTPELVKSIFDFDPASFPLEGYI